MLTDASPRFVARVKKAYGNRLNGDLSVSSTQGVLDEDELARRLSDGSPGVVVVGPDAPVERTLEISELLDRVRPDISVVIVAEPTPDLWERAVQAGARDVVDPSVPDDELHDRLERARETSERRRSCAEQLAASSIPARARVITVVSAKGGSGKTALATNLAVALALTHPGEVALVDLDLQFGDVAGALRLDPEYSILDAGAGDDDTLLKAFLSLHPSSHLAVLCAPERPEDAEDIGQREIRRLLANLGEQYRWLVVDTGAGLDEATLAAAESATDLVLVSPTEVASIRALRKEIDIFDQLGITADRHFVLNRCDAEVGLDPDDIEEVIGFRASVTIPGSRSVPLAMNQGTPVIEAEPDSAVARSFQALAEQFDGVPRDTAGRRRWFERRGRR
jgi:pilus assembly protein CpaE